MKTSMFSRSSFNSYIWEHCSIPLPSFTSQSCCAPQTHQGDIMAEIYPIAPKLQDILSQGFAAWEKSGDH